MSEVSLSEDMVSADKRCNKGTIRVRRHSERHGSAQPSPSDIMARKAGQFSRKRRVRGDCEWSQLAVGGCCSASCVVIRVG